MKVFSGMYLAKSDEQILFLGMYFVESGYGEFWNVDKKNLIYSYFLFQNFRVFLKTDREGFKFSRDGWVAIIFVDVEFFDENKHIRKFIK